MEQVLQNILGELFRVAPVAALAGIAWFFERKERLASQVRYETRLDKQGEEARELLKAQLESNHKLAEALQKLTGVIEGTVAKGPTRGPR